MTANDSSRNVAPGPPPLDDDPSTAILLPGRVLLTAEARRAETARRERADVTRGGLALVVMALAGAGALAKAGERSGASALVGALVGLAALTLVHVVRVHRGAPRDQMKTLIGVAAALVALTTVARVGPLSFATVPLPLLVFYFGLDDDRRRAWSVYLVCAGGSLVTAVLTLVGVIRLTQSIVALTFENYRAIVNLTVFLEILLGSTFAMANAFREGTHQAMRELALADRAIREREALLDETRAEVARVRGAGAVGPYTGETAGSYVLGRVLGRGGMGEVYEGRHATTGDPVAVKILHEHLQNDRDSLTRFFREAKICGDLDSLHLTRLFETGLTPDGVPFLAMELLSGEDLSTKIRRQGTLSLADVCELVTQIGEGLAVAHAAHVVHRDLKPQNVFQTTVNGKPIWKVLDFGVSKITDAASALTHDKIIGTPAYMSPEQASGLGVDHRSDVYSLGALAYRALTGRLPHEGPDTITVLKSLMRDVPAAPSTLVPVPKSIDAVFLVALAKQPAERFRSAGELARALAVAARGSLPPALARMGDDVARPSAPPKRRTSETPSVPTAS